MTLREYASMPIVDENETIAVFSGENLEHPIFHYLGYIHAVDESLLDMEVDNVSALGCRRAYQYGIDTKYGVTQIWLNE